MPQTRKFGQAPELALGSDIMSASYDGYALAKVGGKGTALETLKNAMQTRL